MEKQLCHVCCRADDELKMMLYFILKRLKRISNQYIPDYRDHSDSTPKYTHHSFGRLLGVVMGGNTHHPSFRTCPHEKFSRYFRRKLKCDNATFHDLCSEFVEKIAERNYHIQVLNIQLRNLSETCLALSNLPEAEKVCSLQQQRLENARQNVSSFVGQHIDIRVEGPNHLQPIFNQYGTTFSSIPVLFVGLGVSSNERQNESFIRSDNN